MIATLDGETLRHLLPDRDLLSDKTYAPDGGDAALPIFSALLPGLGGRRLVMGRDRPLLERAGARSSPWHSDGGASESLASASPALNRELAGALRASRSTGCDQAPHFHPNRPLIQKCLDPSIVSR